MAHCPIYQLFIIQKRKNRSTALSIWPRLKSSNINEKHLLPRVQLEIIVEKITWRWTCFSQSLAPRTLNIWVMQLLLGWGEGEEIYQNLGPAALKVVMWLVHTKLSKTQEQFNIKNFSFVLSSQWFLEAEHFQFWILQDSIIWYWFSRKTVNLGIVSPERTMCWIQLTALEEEYIQTLW